MEWPFSRWRLLSFAYKIQVGTGQEANDIPTSIHKQHQKCKQESTGIRATAIIRVPALTKLQKFAKLKTYWSVLLRSGSWLLSGPPKLFWRDSYAMPYLLCLHQSLEETIVTQQYVLVKEVLEYAEMVDHRQRLAGLLQRLAFHLIVLPSASTSINERTR